MGTDIHFYVEKKTGDVWSLVYPETLVEIREEAEHSIAHSVDSAKRQDLYDRFPGTWVETYEEWKSVKGSYDDLIRNPLYVGRNYDLFAILADVRNGRGFAGLRTGEGFNPIAEPRGIPDDASKAYAWEAERYGGDGHSHSWFTVRELLTYDWDQKTNLCGWVGPVNYKEFKENGAPSSWAGGVSGGGVGHISNEEMENHISREKPDPDDPHDFKANVFTSISWERTYRQCVGRFLTKTLPALQELGDPDKVRIVFFFDC